MTIIQALENLLVIIGVMGTFFATLKYLIRFQRKIDRLLILSALSSSRIEDIEGFLEKETVFKSKKQIQDSELPEINTDFI